MSVSWAVLCTWGRITLLFGAETPSMTLCGARWGQRLGGDSWGEVPDIMSLSAADFPSSLEGLRTDTFSWAVDRKKGLSALLNPFHQHLLIGKGWI